MNAIWPRSSQQKKKKEQQRRREQEDCPTVHIAVAATVHGSVLRSAGLMSRMQRRRHSPCNSSVAAGCCLVTLTGLQVRVGDHSLHDGTQLAPFLSFSPRLHHVLSLSRKMGKPKAPAPSRKLTQQLQCGLQGAGIRAKAPQSVRKKKSSGACTENIGTNAGSILAALNILEALQNQPTTQ